jgi:glycosyltransferase involved in cell wall biosynthesis
MTLVVDRVTPLILTLDEEANIGRVLDRLRWAHRVVVVDSGSLDGTLAIIAGYPNAEVFSRPFDDHVSQWNYGLDQVQTSWVLALDADYILGAGFEDEVASLPESHEAAGFEARFRYCVGGRPLRGSLYPPKVVLFRRSRGRYRRDGHTQLLDLDGPVGRLQTPIDHDDRKPLRRWLANQQRYAELEVDKLLSTPAGALGRVDRLRRLGWLVPLLTPAYCLVGKGLALDGRAGLHYTAQRTYAEVLLALKLLDRRMGHKAS